MMKRKMIQEADTWNNMHISEYQPDNYFIISQTNGLYLEVQGGKAFSGANVDTWAGHKSSNQQWMFKRISTPDVSTEPSVKPTFSEDKEEADKENNNNIANTNESVNKPSTTTVAIPITKLHVRGETIYLKKGTKRKISTIVIPMEAADQIVFTSSNSKVATVNKKGVIKAKKAGKAVITVRTLSGIVRNVNVQVKKKAVKVKQVSYVKKKVTLQKGYLGFLDYKVTPWNTTDKMTWASSKESVITVDDSGRYWTRKKGTSKITIKIGKKKTVFRVKVK